MIIRSSNKPLEITFGEDITSIRVIRITLWNDGTLLKAWTKEGIEIIDDKVIAPLTQEETAQFPSCQAKLEIKWLDVDDKTEFAEKVTIAIVDRKDLEVM